LSTSAAVTPTADRLSRIWGPPLGSQRWGIDGYDTDSARGLLSNILLYTAAGKRRDPVDSRAQPVGKGVDRTDTAP